MLSELYIVGTDTGVGKTVVTAACCALLRHRKVLATPLKPVQTGAAEGPDGLLAPDLEFVLSAAGLVATSETAAMMAPFLYEPACSPHLAGRLAGRRVTVEAVLACAEKLLARYGSLIVEGAGGVMVPLNDSATMLDLMTALDMPVVVVALDGLGTINHTLLTLAALRQAGLELLGVVFNQPEPPADDDAFLRHDNPATISRFSGAAVLGNIPHTADLAADNANSWTRIEAGLTGLPAILERLKAQ